MSEGSDLLIFAAPSRSDMIRAASGGVIESGRVKTSCPRPRGSAKEPKSPMPSQPAPPDRLVPHFFSIAFAHGRWPSLAGYA